MREPSAQGSTARFDPLTIPLKGTQVVEASAGTGKTYSITLLYLRGLLEAELEPRSILVVTFTRAATAELRQRIREGVTRAHALLEQATAGGAPMASLEEDETFRALLAPYTGDKAVPALQRLSRALDGLDRASIFTIDGFCQRVLSQHAFEAGLAFETELVSDGDNLVEALAGDLWIARFAGAAPHELDQTAYARPEAVFKLLRQRLAHPALPVAPAAISEAAWDGIRGRYARACAHYLTARERSGTDADVLSAVKLVRKRIRTVHALNALDSLARGEASPDGRRPENWEYVSAAENAALCRDRQAPPSLPVFAAVDALLEAAEAAHRAAHARDAHPFLEAGQRAYATLTVARGRLTFSAIKTTLRELLDAPCRGPALSRALAETYGLSLVDECQDTDAAQFSIFDRIFSAQGRPLLFIGDPKQAIYSFRGADVHAYLDARDAASACYTMGRNFRSRPELVFTLNRLYAEAEAPFGDVGISYARVEAGRSAAELDTVTDPDAEGALELLYVPDQGNMVDRLGADIVRTLHTATRHKPGGEPECVRPRHVAVLCRSNGQVDQVCRALRSLGVPAVSSSNRSVLDTEEAGHLLRLLRATLDPGDSRAVRAALLTPLFDYTPRALAALVGDDVGWDSVVQGLIALRDTLQAHGIGHAFARFCREHGLEARLLRRPDGFRVVTNLSHLVELMMLAQSELRLGPEGVVSFLERARAGHGDEGAASEERGLRLEHSGDAVQVLTVHKSKGREFDITYVLGLGTTGKGPSSPALVHDPEAGTVLATHLDALPELKGLAQRELHEESARVAYVALTRARLALRVVFEPRSRSEQGSTTGLASTALGAVLVGPALPPPDKAKSPAHRVDGDALVTFLEQRFRTLRATHDASIGVRRLDQHDPVAYVSRKAPPTLAAPVACTRSYAGVARTSSFSALVADAEHVRPADRDAANTDPDTTETATDDPLEGLPPGRGLGVLVHEILELVDFDADSVRIEAAVVQATRGSSLFAPHASALSESVTRVLTTRLVAGGPRLADIPRARTFRELEFHLSVHRDGGLLPSELGALFTAHGIPRGAPDYGSHVAALPFGSLHGYLHGFIDLIFEHGGRFYVVDYKSNHLGPASAYAGQALVEPVARSHYALQYALYTLALHRLLKVRIAGYDYTTHMGGALYLFLRGMFPAFGPTSGVFYELLPFGFVDALDAMFDFRDA